MPGDQLTDPLHEQNTPSESEGKLPEDIVADLLQFDTSPMRLPLRVLLHSLWTAVRDAGRILPAVAGTQIVVNFITIFYNMTKNPLVQASFGLFFSYHLVFVIAIQVSLSEKMGIALSVEYGKKNYYGCRRIFMQGILTVFLVYLFLSMPLTLCSSKVLRLLGIPDENTELVQSANNIMAFTMLVQMANELVKSFCLAQGQEEIIGYVGLISNLCWTISLYVSIVKLGFGLLGYVITRFVIGLVELSVNLWVFRNKTAQQTQGLVSLKEVLVGFPAFFVESLKFAIGTYSEYLGYEISTFFVASLKNDNKTSAFTALMSITGLGYCLGLSFSQALRTRVNVLIGLGLSNTARNYYIFFCPALIILGLPFTWFLIAKAEAVAAIYASANSEMMGQFTSLVRVYGVWAGMDLMWHSACSGMKVTGQVDRLIGFNVTYMLGMNVLSGFICTWLGLGPVQIFIGLLTCGFCLLSSSFFGSLKGEWAASEMIEVAGHQFSV